MAKYINEWTELRHYRELAVRYDELIRLETNADWDRNADWCDKDLEELRHDAYVAIKNYREAIGARRDAMTNVFYDKLDFADTFKPRRSFWDIFKRKES